jgi:hypothetical protein
MESYARQIVTHITEGDEASFSLLHDDAGDPFVSRQETDMSTRKPVQSLIRSKVNGGEIELTEHDLRHVTGAAKPNKVSSQELRV